MEKYKYDEKNGLWYELQGDYYLPCLKLLEEEQVHIGIWGQRHLNYLRQNKRVLLSSLQISGQLNSYHGCICFQRIGVILFGKLGKLGMLGMLGCGGILTNLIQQLVGRALNCRCSR